MRKIAVACLSIFGVTLFLSNSFAGEKEEAVMAGCAVTAATVVGYAGCVAAGWAGQAADTCVNEPSKCYGGDGKKLLCSVGIGGCPKPAEPAQLIRVVPFRGGCEAIYNTGIYWSADCQNLRGGGRTINAWDVPEAHWSFVRAMVIFRDCIVTAFNSGIYKSCNGLNLGGGGETVKVYEGAPVEAMDVVAYQGRLVLRTKFANNPYYCDPSGDHPGGGLGVDHCDHGSVNSPPAIPLALTGEFDKDRFASINNVHGDCNSRTIAFRDRFFDQVFFPTLFYNCTYINWGQDVLPQVAKGIGLSDASSRWALVRVDGDCNGRIVQLYDKRARNIQTVRLGADNCQTINFNGPPAAPGGWLSVVVAKANLPPS